MRSLLRVRVVALGALTLVSCAGPDISYVTYGGYSVVKRDCSPSNSLLIDIKGTTEPTHRLYCVLRNQDTRPMFIHLDKITLTIGTVIQYQPATILDPNETSTSSTSVRQGLELASIQSSRPSGSRTTAFSDYGDIEKRSASTFTVPKRFVLYPGTAIELDLKDYITMAMYEGRYVSTSDAVGNPNRANDGTVFVRIPQQSIPQWHQRLLKNLQSLFRNESSQLQRLHVYFSWTETGDGDYAHCDFQPETLRLNQAPPRGH